MTILFEWTQSLSVGDESIDEQHQYIIGQGNNLSAITSDNVKRHIMDLYKYMSRHFAMEEQHMRHIGYPDIQMHHQLHEDMIEKTNILAKSFKPTRHNTEMFRKFLLEWITDHILVQDMKYFLFVQQQKTIKPTFWTET